MPSRSAFVCWTTHQALSCSSALAASSSVCSFLLPRTGARTRMLATASRGVRATARTLAADEAPEQVARRAWVYAVLVLVPPRLGLVGQREHKLLTRRAEVA